MRIQFFNYGPSSSRYGTVGGMAMFINPQKTTRQLAQKKRIERNQQEKEIVGQKELIHKFMVKLTGWKGAVVNNIFWFLLLGVIRTDKS